jgi:hypothetical protein
VPAHPPDRSGQALNPIASSSSCRRAWGSGVPNGVSAPPAASHRISLRPGWPQGMPMRLIATKLRGKMLVISYNEEAKDNSAIRSPADWTEIATFEKLLSTFTFTRR